MPITVDLTSQVGQVRLEIGDDDDTSGHGKRPAGRNLSDGAITLWLARAALYTSDPTRVVLLAAASACEQLARDWSSVADISLPTRSENAGAVAAKWAARAAELRKQAGSAGGLRIRSLAVPANLDTTEYGL